jgi:hypothetical protein
MATDRHSLHKLVDQLPDAELAAARRFLEFLSHSPIDEEIDEQTAAEIRASLADPRPDIPHEELWARLEQKCTG